MAPLLIWRLKKKKDWQWFLFLFLFVSFWGAIFLILPFSRPLYLRFPLLQKFQFVWRWLSLAIFIPPLLWAGLTSLLTDKKQALLVLSLMLLLLGFTFSYWQPQDYLLKPESFYNYPYPGTTDTGESAPIWSVRFMEQFPQSAIQVIDGQAEVAVVSQVSNNHQFTVKATTPTRLVDNTLYFPGWQVLVDRQPVEIQFQDPNWRGLITFRVLEGEHQIEVIFGETRLRQLANLVSLTSLAGLILVSVVLKLARK